METFCISKTTQGFAQIGHEWLPLTTLYTALQHISLHYKNKTTENV